MKEELKIFFTALMFYTRLPIPKWVDYSQLYLDRSSRYFPLMGWIVGGVAATTFYLSQQIFPNSISILLSMMATILLTGAFHEDGFADMCDGFGGGWTKSQVLDIMKDSRIGSYGAIGLVFMLLAKFLFIQEMSPAFIPVALIVAHSLSRGAVNIFRITHSYVRENDDAKAKPMAQQMTLKDFSVSMFISALPLLLLPMPMACWLIVFVLVAEYLLSKYIVGRIGGYTGDCLGATQQVCEAVCYLAFIISWKFI